MTHRKKKNGTQQKNDTRENGQRKSHIQNKMVQSKSGTQEK